MVKKQEEELQLSPRPNPDKLLWFSDAVYLGQSQLFGSRRLRHGLGLMIYLSGRVYEGFWARDKRSGKGYERFKNGDFYLGEFREGKPNGKGRRMWTEKGEVYEGEWKDGLMSGVGKWTLPHQGVVRVDPAQNIDKVLTEESYTGRFEKNLFQGYGIYKVTYRSKAL